MCGSPNYSYQPLIRIHLRVNNQRCFNYFLISLYSMVFHLSLFSRWKPKKSKLLSSLSESTSSDLLSNRIYLWVPQLLLIYFRPEKVIVFSEVFDVFAGFVSSLSDEFDGLWIQIWLFEKTDLRIKGRITVS